MNRGQTHGGKGSSQRVTDAKKFSSNYDAIYNKPTQAPKEADKKISVKTA